MNPTAESGVGARRGALQVVLIYAVFAAAWILFSDRAVEALFSEPAQIVRVSIFKGWAFVGVTAVMLYALVRRLQDRQLAAVRREVALHADKLRALRLVDAIAEGSGDAIFAKDLDGRYLLFNRAAGAFVGKPADAVLGHDDSAIFPAAQAAMLREIDLEVIRSGRVVSAEERLSTVAGERVFLATKGPLRDADGRVTGVFGICRDVTAGKQAEAELRQLTDDLTATLQAIPDLLFELDASGRYVKVEATAYRPPALAPEQLLGRTVGDVLPADAARIVMAAVADAARNGTDYGRTISLELPGGELHHYELSVARKTVATDSLQRFVVLSRDVTERHAVEEELRRNNDELQRFNRATVGRELDMIALKEEVNALSRELGRAPPYRLDFGNDGER